MRTLWLLHLVMGIFWVINIVQVCNGYVTVLKVIGILIAPLGAVMGMMAYLARRASPRHV